LLAQARAGGADLVLIDTPPEADGIASAAAAADLMLIPCRPSALDLDAVAASVRIATTTGRPIVVAINAAPVVGVEVAEMRAALAGAGVPGAPVVLHQRKAFSSRMQEGRTAGEHEPDGKAAAEVTALFRWLCQQV
jgi:chromosome partitioning protein